ncbi:MAG: pyridoxal 5'-phosphate synthase glutaminase subunit PdxT [Candidatus Thermoplasmatota archaeon]
MVTIRTVGVLCIQGAVHEHIAMMEQVFKNHETLGRVVPVRSKKDIDLLDALILPGGESTTISKMLYSSGMYILLRQRLESQQLPIMGTCAGCVLLAKKITDSDTGVHLLEAMDMCVERNAFGRQKESFEQEITFLGFQKPFPAVFIRAPLITEVWGKRIQVLATLDTKNQKIVAARQNNLLALSFHPELTTDLRIHEYFFKMIL